MFFVFMIRFLGRGPLRMLRVPLLAAGARSEPAREQARARKFTVAFGRDRRVRRNRACRAVHSGGGCAPTLTAIGRRQPEHALTDPASSSRIATASPALSYCSRVIWLGERRGDLVDWVTQRWVQITGRRVALADAPWLAGPSGSVRGIGADFFTRWGESQGMRVLPSGIDDGLVDGLAVLTGPTGCGTCER
jgi:hypothetical protein